MQIGKAAKLFRFPSETSRSDERQGPVDTAEPHTNLYRTYNAPDVYAHLFLKCTRSIGCRLREYCELRFLICDKHKSSADVMVIVLQRFRDIEQKKSGIACTRGSLE